MKYLSVCSGIEAATVAWHPLGCKPVAFSEIEPFPAAVLAHHYHDVPNQGDMTKFKEWKIEPIDVLVGGTPCQSFSIAGLRKGLADPRGNLMLTYLAIAELYRPEWLVWENVPGVLSSNKGRDFGTFLGGLAELRYGFAYRILDAQYFGVAQRRRRVFVVANSRSWQRSAAVLFERNSLQGNPAPSREKGQEIAGTISKCSFDGGAGGRPEGAAGNHFIAGTIGARTGRSIGAQDAACGHMLPVYGIDYENNAHGIDDATGPLMKGSPTGGGRPLPAIVSQMRGAAMCLTTKVRIDAESETLIPTFGGVFSFSPQATSSQGVRLSNISATLDTSKIQGVHHGTQVRRLTPVECERLQGFPDGYTAIPWRGKSAEECPDGPRYKALGNSMAVPVMRWIGERIAMVNEIAEAA